MSSEHYDDRQLMAFIRKTAPAGDLATFESHLSACSMCYENYVELVKHARDRIETPDAAFVDRILQGAASGTPSVSITISLRDKIIEFLDSVGMVIQPVSIPTALHALTSDSPTSAIAVDLAGRQMTLQIGSTDKGFRIALSTASSAGLSFIATHEGEEVETLHLSHENMFQTVFPSGVYDLQLEESGKVLGRINLTLREQ